MDDIDRMLTEAATAPADRRLAGLEGAVMTRLATRVAERRQVRVGGIVAAAAAAIGLYGGMAGQAPSPDAALPVYGGGLALAPSNLLAGD